MDNILQPTSMGFFRPYEPSVVNLGTIECILIKSQAFLIFSSSLHFFKLKVLS